MKMNAARRIKPRVDRWPTMLLIIVATMVHCCDSLAADEELDAPTPQTLGDSAEPEEEVVVYAALDREFSEPILQQFEAETGIRVRASYDVESTKTVGLTTRLINEAANPQCDVFWNNEMLHTLRLARAGVLDAYVSDAADNYPPSCVAEDGQWHAFAARARILLINTDRVQTPPSSVLDLAAPQWKGQVGIAKPLFGTTATHFAVLYQRLGPERARRFFESIRANVKVLSGNKQVAQAVSSGQLAWGMTDTDDAMVEIDAGRPVAIVFPDQATERDATADFPSGAMFVPNSLCVIKGAPHPVAARRLVDFLLRPDVERQLAVGASAQFPLGKLAQDTQSRAAPEESIIWLEPDFAAAAAKWDAAAAELESLFSTSDSPPLSTSAAILLGLGALLVIGGAFDWAPPLLGGRRASRTLYLLLGLAAIAIAGVIWLV